MLFRDLFYLGIKAIMLHAQLWQNLAKFWVCEYLPFFSWHTPCTFHFSMHLLYFPGYGCKLHEINNFFEGPKYLMKILKRFVYPLMIFKNVKALTLLTIILLKKFLLASINITYEFWFLKIISVTLFWDPTAAILTLKCKQKTACYPAKSYIKTEYE
jgi:hypothetical protein